MQLEDAANRAKRWRGPSIQTAMVGTVPAKKSSAEFLAKIGSTSLLKTN